MRRLACLAFIAVFTGSSLITFPSLAPRNLLALVADAEWFLNFAAAKFMEVYSRLSTRAVLHDRTCDSSLVDRLMPGYGYSSIASRERTFHKRGFERRLRLWTMSALLIVA
ncbi:hypothetical protein PYCCODRAFT_51880 [Trametes coccinea BRFM310]|uniref:Uncharacterized protein n=1 Tax=Trametes coccinea (strain BRFM310) TaxID=1353009 RepID=A0A1Y2J5W2_TRAC3|nr:hypothetical protein PYCCODRAFT_51880 [Trametes coccinea BRFM310]